FNFTISLSDNNGLYKVCLSAEDYFTGEDWEIKTIKNIQNGELTVSSIYKDYPVVQDSPFQKFYLKITASDESENSITSTKLGFYITKPYPFNLFYESLVLIKEVDGDSVDFREKHGKLGFVQFISKGCLSCVDEAKAMKEMYLDTTYYDLDLYSHSLIGNYTFTEAEFKSFKTRDYKLPYDCFYDNPGNIKHFFETLLGKQIENEVFAVLPDGKIFEYNYLEGNFTDWIRSMYCRAYPN
ncbi:MAG: hypothetical protein KKD38_05330, partial [Candidatus Delongbacteria bacterium]|nr:hypothetical protein [Candidatus Delongbacteria bacterium]MCG2759950.1 hypothetical protein [Candidatus Delongbacteria bacterium]